MFGGGATDAARVAVAAWAAYLPQAALMGRSALGRDLPIQAITVNLLAEWLEAT